MNVNLVCKEEHQIHIHARPASSPARVGALPGSGRLRFGSACHRLLQGHRPLTDQFARRVTDLIVARVTAPGT